MAANQSVDRLIELRRNLHKYPKLGWAEFVTTAMLVKTLSDIDVDELYVGPEMLSADRFRPPSEAQLSEARARSVEFGVDDDLLEKVSDGYTGALAVLNGGPGPTIGLRVDIDGLPLSES